LIAGKRKANFSLPRLARGGRTWGKKEKKGSSQEGGTLKGPASAFDWKKIYSSLHPASGRGKKWGVGSRYTQAAKAKEGEKAKEKNHEQRKRKGHMNSQDGSELRRGKE